MQGVAREFEGKVKCVSENFGSSELAERFGVKRYPAVFVDDVLVAKPKDFGFFGESGSQGAGRYTPWRTQESQDRFRDDLRRLVGKAVRGELSSEDGVDAAQGGDLTELPELDVKDLDGNAVTKASLSRTVTVVDFWATWCPPCIKGLPAMGELQEAHPDDLQVVGIVVESPEDAVRKMVDRLELPFANVLGSPELALAFGDIVAVPTIFVFDRGGKLVKTFYGAPPTLKDELATLVDELIEASDGDDSEGGWVDVPLDSDRWVRAGSVAPAEHLGRSALRLQGSSVALDDVALENVEVEFSMAFTGERGFAGAFWRATGDANRESFYLRPHRTGEFDSCQYTPVFHGSTGWQLYPDGGAAIDFALDAWVDVRLVAWEDTLQVFVDSDEPQLVARMRHEARPGAFGLYAANFAPAWVSGLRYRALDEPPAARPVSSDPTRDGMVTEWSVSERFAESTLDGVHELSSAMLEELEWTDALADSAGICNLAMTGGPAAGLDTRFARFRVEAESPRVAWIEFGFSDRVRVYHDDRLLFEGDDSYRTRDERFLGTIGLHDRVPLRLHAGVNEVTFAVSESFGGWGVTCTVP